MHNKPSSAQPTGRDLIHLQPELLAPELRNLLDGS
jgi:hypothetical protein